MKYLPLVFLLSLWLINSCKNDSTSSRNDVRKCDTETDGRQTYTDSMNLLYPKYMVAGMYQEKDMQRQQIDAQYGFRFSIEAGCVVSDSLVKAIEVNNQKTDSILSKRHGKNWYKRFEKSVDSLYHLDTLARFIAMKNPQVTHF